MEANRHIDVPITDKSVPHSEDVPESTTRQSISRSSPRFVTSKGDTFELDSIGAALPPAPPAPSWSSSLGIPDLPPRPVSLHYAHPHIAKASYVLRSCYTDTYPTTPQLFRPVIALRPLRRLFIRYPWLQNSLTMILASPIIFTYICWSFNVQLSYTWPWVFCVYLPFFIMLMTVVAMELDRSILRHLLTCFDTWFLAFNVLAYTGIAIWRSFVMTQGWLAEDIDETRYRVCWMLSSLTFACAASTIAMLDALPFAPRRFKVILLVSMLGISFHRMLSWLVFMPKDFVDKEICFLFCSQSTKIMLSMLWTTVFFYCRYLVNMLAFGQAFVVLKSRIKPIHLAMINESVSNLTQSGRLSSASFAGTPLAEEGK